MRKLPPIGSDELGDMGRALVVFRDNAREIRNAREEAEAARHQAEAASRTKSAFLANMSHELRTPLNAIIGYSEILREDAQDRGDKASEDDLVKIETAGKHLLGLINDILDLSKIEAGRMDLHLENVDLNRLLAEVRVLVTPLIDKNGNRLDIDAPADIGAMHVDLVKLKQSLINLLSNAAKFTKGGLVKLSVGKHDTGPRPADLHLRGLRFRHRHERRAARPAVPGVHPGRCLDHPQLRRHRARPHDLQAFLHHARRRHHGDQRAGQGIDLHHHIAGRRQGCGCGPADRYGASAGAGGDLTGRSVLIVDDDPTVHDVLRATIAKEGLSPAACL